MQRHIGICIVRLLLFFQIEVNVLCIKKESEIMLRLVGVVLC